MEALNEHLEAWLAVHIFDNDKLVTYKWLSSELRVHVNTAKRILWEFYQKYRASNNIECTYLLMGLLKDKRMRVEVVKESNLSKAREKFSQVMSEHVYSVHRPLADLQLLAASSGSGDINYIAIKCDACGKRNDEEMQLFRWGPAVKKIMENTTDSMNPSKIGNNGFNKPFNAAGKSRSPEKLKSSFQERDAGSMTRDNELGKKGKDSVRNQDSTERDQTWKKDKILVRKDGLVARKTRKNSTEKSRGSRAVSTARRGFLSNDSAKMASLIDRFVKLASPSKSIEQVRTSEIKNDRAQGEFIEGQPSGEGKKLQGNKRNESAQADGDVEKRRRIVVQNDSKDSQVPSDVEMVDLVAETEPEMLAKPSASFSTSKVKHEDGRGKVFKLVDKICQEGEYIATRKENVYLASCLEDQQEMRRREIEGAEAKMKMARNKKQAKLTDFFKRSRKNCTKMV